VGQFETLSAHEAEQVVEQIRAFDLKDIGSQTSACFVVFFVYQCVGGFGSMKASRN
jgi:hypothetical protein